MSLRCYKNTLESVLKVFNFYIKNHVFKFEKFRVNFVTSYIVFLVSFIYLNRFMLVVISVIPCSYLVNKTQRKSLTTS